MPSPEVVEAPALERGPALQKSATARAARRLGRAPRIAAAARAGRVARRARRGAAPLRLASCIDALDHDAAQEHGPVFDDILVEKLARSDGLAPRNRAARLGAALAPLRRERGARLRFDGQPRERGAVHALRHHVRQRGARRHPRRGAHALHRAHVRGGALVELARFCAASEPVQRRRGDVRQLVHRWERAEAVLRARQRRVDARGEEVEAAELEVRQAEAAEHLFGERRALPLRLRREQLARPLERTHRTVEITKSLPGLAKQHERVERVASRQLVEAHGAEQRGGRGALAWESH